MKYKEMYLNVKPKDIIKENSLLVSNSAEPCIICGEPTKFIDFCFIDFCGECRICSEECSKEFNNMVNKYEKTIEYNNRSFSKISLEQFKKDNCDNALYKEIYDAIVLPVRATNLSAGYDFYSPDEYVLKAKETIKIPTGIKVQMMDDEWLGIYIRSSLGFKYNVRLKNSTGIIDADYINAKNEGHIWIALCNHGDKDLVIKKGEPFAQGIFQKYFLTQDDMPKKDNRIGGIGSTN